MHQRWRKFKDLDFYVPTSHEGILGLLCSQHLDYASGSQP